MSNYTTASKHTPRRAKAASEKASLVWRLPEEDKRQILSRLAARGLKIQAFMERAVQLALAEIKTEKN